MWRSRDERNHNKHTEWRLTTTCASTITNDAIGIWRHGRELWLVQVFSLQTHSERKAAVAHTGLWVIGRVVLVVVVGRVVATRHWRSSLVLWRVGVHVVFAIVVGTSVGSHARTAVVVVGVGRGDRVLSCHVGLGQGTVERVGLRDRRQEGRGILWTTDRVLVEVGQPLRGSGVDGPLSWGSLTGEYLLLGRLTSSKRGTSLFLLLLSLLALVDRLLVTGREANCLVLDLLNNQTDGGQGARSALRRRVYWLVDTILLHTGIRGLDDTIHIDERRVDSFVFFAYAPVSTISITYRCLPCCSFRQSWCPFGTLHRSN